MFVIAMLGQKGGPGKSMVARLLAVEMTKLGTRVKVLDADPGQQTFTEWNKARALNKLEPRIDVEVIDPEAEPDFRLGELAGDDVEVVLVDAPGWSDRTTLELGERADLCILPTRCTADDLRPTVRLRHELVADGVNPERVLIVLNAVKSASAAKAARKFFEAAEITEAAVIAAELPDQAAYQRGADSGQAPSEVTAGDTATPARAVAAEIIDRVKALQKEQAKQKPKRFVDTGKW